MSAATLAADARQAYAAGKPSLATRLAWSAVNQAMNDSDEAPVADVLELAEDLVATTDKGHGREAAQLAAYCRAVLAGVGGGVEAPGAFGRLFSIGGLTRRRDRMRCPECAEDIHVEAKVCRHCGHRLAPPTTDG